MPPKHYSWRVSVPSPLPQESQRNVRTGCTTQSSKSWKKRSKVDQRCGSILKMRKAATSALLKGSGEFTNAKASRASGVAPASDAWCRVDVQPTTARAVSESDNQRCQF